MGSALVQLAKHRGVRILALTDKAKAADILALGASRVLPRPILDKNGAPDPSFTAALAEERITVLADVVGGPAWPALIDLLQAGGRYTCSGAIAGPMVELDLRTLYLRDLTFTGSTVIGLDVMPRLVRYIETGVVKPLLAARYKLSELHQAQTAFIAKKHIGNIVVLP